MSQIPWVEVLPFAAETSTGFDAERRAFQRLLPDLLADYEGRFVAIHGQQIYDSGEDEIALIDRVRARVGLAPIFVGLVTKSPQSTRLRSRYRAVSEG